MTTKRPPHVKAGDRVRITIVHTGVVEQIDDDGFVLLPRPGRPVRGSFHGDAKFVSWEVLPSEPPDGSVVRLPDPELDVRVYERDDRDAADPTRAWYGAGEEQPRAWDQLCEMARPGVPVLLAPDPSPRQVP